jgi:hypothetical protein
MKLRRTGRTEEAATPRSARLSLKAMVLLSLTIGVMVFSGLAFTYKMIEFAVTISDADVAGFGATVVGTYLTGMLPLLLLTLWATFSGRFRDVERPKYRMFELHEEIERGGELRIEGGSRG